MGRQLREYEVITADMTCSVCGESGTCLSATQRGVAGRPELLVCWDCAKDFAYTHGLIDDLTGGRLRIAQE